MLRCGTRMSQLQILYMAKKVGPSLSLFVGSEGIIEGFYLK